LAVQKLHTRQAVPEADRVHDAAAQKLLHCGGVGRVLQYVRVNLLDREVNRLGHLLRLLVVEAESRRNAKQHASAGDISWNRHG
jgi:hypothetical protein